MLHHAYLLLLFGVLSAQCATAQTRGIGAQLAAIQAIDNDSVALHQLDSLAKTVDGSVADVLNVRIKAVERLNKLQQYAKALELTNQCLVQAQHNHLDSMEAALTKFLGATNYYMDQKRAAIPLFAKAVDLSHKGGYWELEASCLNNLGAAHADVQQYTLAEPYLLQSIAIMTEHGKGDEQVALRTYRVLARVYSQNGKLDQAERIYLDLIDKAKANKDTALLCDNLMFYSELLGDRGEFENALQMSGQALEYLRLRGNSYTLQGGLAMHGHSLARLGRYREAYKLQEELALLMRTTFAKDLEKEVGEMEVKYRLSQIQQEKDMMALKAKKQRQVYHVGFGASVVLLLLGFYIVYQKRTARQKAAHLTQMAEADKLRFRDVLEAEESERSRIAKDLHDGLGQLLSTARLNVAGLEDSVEQDALPDVDRSLKIIDEACVELRSISHNMMPSTLIRLGLIPTLQELVNNVNAAKGVQIEFTTNVDVTVGQSLDITIYRVIQEVLNNMIKHAKANQIDMNILRDGQALSINIKDNGVGFNTAMLEKSEGLGWKNVHSRIAMLGGNIDLRSEPNKGTMVTIRLMIEHG